MSNGNGATPQSSPGVPVMGIMCPWNPKYPATVTPKNPGQPGGYPAMEDGPRAVAPGCAPGLPTIVFAGAWQPYPPLTSAQ